MSAYNQAEKDVVAKSSPDLHYNKYMCEPSNTCIQELILGESL